MPSTPVARQRRQTLYFLDMIRRYSPVHLDTEVDMTRISAERAEAKAAGQRYAVVGYVLLTGARVLARHPQANAAFAGRWRPRVAEYPQVSAKLALDTTIGGRRAVLAAVLPAETLLDLDAIQRQVRHYRDGDPNRMPEFAAVRTLQKLPVPLGRLLAALATRPLGPRPDRMGTFAVSSLGHGVVDGFHSVGGTTVTLGVGRVVDRPVVRDGQVVVAPILRLNLTFDHRVLDGAEAAEILAEIKNALENFPETGPGIGLRPPAAVRVGAAAVPAVQEARS